MIKLLIADDHKMLRDGIKAMMVESHEIAVVGEASNGLEVLELLENIETDVLLLDINMPHMDGVETCKKVIKLYPFVSVLALTMYDEGAMISKMVKQGAKGYILKNTGKEQLINAIKTVYNGQNFFSDQVKETLITSMSPNKKSSSGAFIPKLTKREKEIINLIVNEYTTTEIADQLFISEKTVETHRKNVLQKLNVRNTAGLVRIVMEKGLLT
jgi:DNA-binding NarL/FixJ family response regulator